MAVNITYYKGIRKLGGKAPSLPPSLEDPEPVINPPIFGGGGGAKLYTELGDTTDANYLGKNGFVPVVVNERELTLFPFPEFSLNRLINGGVVQWTGTGYNFNVSEANAIFDSVPLSSSADTLTLTTPDATNDRIDLFVLDITFSSGVPISMAPNFITGTPAATPVEPQIDPSYQIRLTSVDVPASSTEPTLTEEIIYDENTEWTGTSAGTGTANFASTVDPYKGSVSVETTDIQNGFYIQFDNGTPIDVSGFQTLGFQLKLKSSMPANQNITGIFLDNSGNTASSSFNLAIDKSSTSYQFVGLVLSSLIFSDLDARYLRFTFNRSGGSPTYSGYFLDILKLEGGINPPQTVGSFTGLNDTPSTYSGQGGKTVAVKADESGLEFVTGGGGASTFLALTDTPASYSGQAGLFPRVNGGENALIFDSVSPYDLDQEGASDGQVLTWVNANNRYEPVTPSGGGSNWTLVGSNIYRDSQVVVGRTTFPANNTFTVQSKNAGSNKFLLFNNNAGSELFSITDAGTLRVTGVFTAVGINHFFQSSVASAIICDFKNLGGTNVLRVADSVVVTGNFTANGTNHVIRSLVPGATILDVRDAGALNIFRVQSARIDIGDGVNMFFATTTGTKIGTTTSQKLAFWNKTPIIQPTTAITGATRVGGGGTTITDTDTFGGYTIAQLAAILINTGLTA